MSKLIEIKRRIKSTKNIKQITKAMEMVSAVELKKSQILLNINREYIETLKKTVKDLSSYLEDIQNIEDKNNLIIVITPHKGFVGPLILNLEKQVLSLINSNKEKKFKIIGIDKKALSFIFSLNIEVLSDLEISNHSDITELYSITDLIVEEIKEKKIDSIYIIYTKFKNMMFNEIVTEKILPIDIKEDEYSDAHYVKKEQKDNPAIYDFENNFEDIYIDTLKLYIPSIVQSCIIESSTSENAIRMLTMRNSSDNADELNKNLVFESNKIRQGSITQEVIEIASASNI